MLGVFAKGSPPDPAPALCFILPAPAGKSNLQGRPPGQVTCLRMSEALVPPKPKLFDIAALTRPFLALCGIRSITVSKLGLSRLRVGGMI